MKYRSMTRVGIVGATGAVGREILECLRSENFPFSDIFLFASSKSVSEKIGELPVREFSIESVIECECKIVFFAVGSEFSLKYAPILMNRAACFVIDNSGAFRSFPEVPLVVPELNSDKLSAVKEKGKGIIANPNCTTAILAMALFPLHKAFGGATRLICSTYQAASGAGEAGMQELSKALEKRVKNEKFIPTVFSHDLSCNVIPLIDAVGSGSGGYTQEELKMAVETRKIFDSSFDISCTAVRVPTMRSHCVSASVEFNLAAPPERVLQVLQGSVGVHVVEVPTPEEATRRKDVLVGRIRQSLVFGNRGIDMFVASDQLLRGAALNAVRIALLLV